MKRTEAQCMIDEVMDYFDFSKTHKTMVALNWKLHTENGYEIPDEHELRVDARRLLMDCIDNSENNKEDYNTVATGPFKVTCLRYDGKLTKLELEFVVTSWETYCEDFEI